MGGQHKLWVRSARQQKFFKLVRNPAFWAAIISAITLGWTVHSHSLDQEMNLSQELRGKRAQAYEDLLTLSARASSGENDAAFFKGLYSQVHPLVRGRLSLYGSGDVHLCAVELEILLYQCAHTPDPTTDKACDAHNLHLLNENLAMDARLSLAQTWDQTPERFEHDALVKNECFASADIWKRIHSQVSPPSSTAAKRP